MPRPAKRKAPAPKAKSKAQPKSKARAKSKSAEVKEEETSSGGCEFVLDNDAMLAAVLGANETEAVEQSSYDHQFRPPKKGDRCTTAFITRSWLTEGMLGYYAQVPASKKDEVNDVVRIFHAANEIASSQGGIEVNLTTLGIGDMGGTTH